MKDIKNTDKNFERKAGAETSDIMWIDATEENLSLFGVKFDGERYIRMDLGFAESINDGIKTLATMPSGGRLVFETDSPFISVRVKAERMPMSHMSLCGSAGFDLYIDSGEGFKFINVLFPEYRFENGYESICRLKNADMKKCMMHFPTYNEVRELHIGIKSGSVIKKLNPYINEKPIVFYGSSITQGASASHGGNCYPAIVSRMLNRDFINLGFSGSARGEIEMAEYISKIPMSLFVYDYDHNEVFFPELFRDKHPAFYDVVRKANKDLPVLFMSAPYSPRAEGTLEKTRVTVIDTYEKAKARGEKVAFVDGKTIYGSEYYDCGSVDGAHPTDYGFVKMAEAVYKGVSELL